MLSLNEKIINLYKALNLPCDGLPIVNVPSPVAGAFVASMLAHRDHIDGKVIKEVEEQAFELLFAETPAKKLVDKYYDALSHHSTKGAGAYCNQPGGNIVVKMIALLRNETPTRVRPIDFITLSAATATVRKRIHTLYKRRVRYHAYVDATRTGMVDGKAAIWPNKRFCIVPDSPTQTLLNNNLQPHCTTGPSISYRDGWQLFSVAGIEVKGQYVTAPESLTVKIINKEKNVETKRALIQLLGYDRYLEQTGATLIDEDQDQDQKPRQLYSLMQNTQTWSDDGINLLIVYNSTPELDGTFKKYYLQVPGEVKGVAHALNWMIDDTRNLNLQMRIET